MSENEQQKTSRSPEEIKALKGSTMNLSIVEGSMWSVMWAMGESFIAPFAIMLRAGNFAMSLLGTLPIIVGSFGQIAGASLLERTAHRRLVVSIFAMMQALSYLFLFWVPFIFPDTAVQTIIVITTIQIFAANLGGPAWISLMGDIVPEDGRGSYFGKRLSITMIVVVLSTFAAGRILTVGETAHSLWLGFGILFSMAFVTRAVSSVMLAMHYEPPFRHSKDSYFSFWSFIRKTPKSNFARFTFAITLMNGAAAISAPFFSVYMIRDLNWSMHKFAASQAVMQLAQYVCLRWWGIVGDRHGNRAVIAASSLFLPLLPILWTLSDNFYYILLVQLFSGALWSGFNLASGNFIYDAVTPEKRHRAVSYYSVLNGIFVLLGGSIIGAFLAEYLPADLRLAGYCIHYVSGLPVVFIVSGLVRVVIIIIFLPLFKEVRNIEPISSRKLLWRVAIGEPIINHARHLVGLVWSFKKTGNDNREQDTSQQKP